MELTIPSELGAALAAGQLIPYIGPGVWEGSAPAHPASGRELVAKLTEKVTVSHKLRSNLTGAAQYIENFKHRKTLNKLMSEAFEGKSQPLPLHRWLAGQSQIPLIVDVWYDEAMQLALAGRADWGQVQGVSQAEHHGEWVRYYTTAGELTTAEAAQDWRTLLYRPLGSVSPARNYIVSDSDYVEVLTEIDIQTPIPEAVQRIRGTRGFLFVGCRFTNQLERSFARQIMKRSSGPHWALIEGELTKNEQKFLDEQGITRLALSPTALMD